MKRTSYTLLIAILFVGLTGCGDDSSTGPDVEEDPPQMPEIEQAQPDISFFENNNPEKSTGDDLNATNNYGQAQGIVLWNTALFSLGQGYGVYLNEADQEEADFNDGVWEWSYTLSEQGVSATYRTTAEELANAVEWATYWSFDDGQGNGVDNYKIFEGTISNDGLSGDWTFNATAYDEDVEEETPFLTSTWDNASETEKEITLVMYGEAMDDNTSEETATIYFEQNDADFSMSYDFADGEEYLVEWNTDTNVGSITSNGETICWDENLQDVACN